MRQKGIAHLFLLVVVVVVAIGAIGYLAYQNAQLKNKGVSEISPTPTPVSVMEPTPTASPTLKVPIVYSPDKDWHRITNTTLGLTFCLPPKWDFTKNGDGSFSGQLTYYRDPSYAPWVAQIKSIPYTSGSRREAYYKFWEKEYTDVRSLVMVSDVNINGNTALLISPSQNVETKLSPEGLTLVWYAGGKLWKANISNWSSINDSQSAFLEDFYASVSCSY